MAGNALRQRVAIGRRPASAADLPLLRQLFGDARMELAVLPADTRFVLLDMQFRAQRRQHAAQHPHAQHDILVVDGVDAGQVLIDRSADAVHIVDVTVGLGHRRQGIATAVLTETVDQARAARQRAWLNIWSGNAAAREVCERAGLEPACEEGGYLRMERAVTPAG
jgi:RimJ/RimL family protein N-acetyltransferase